jgi:selenium metabolism protein YedF
MDIVDLRGKPCPIPVIETKKLLASATPGTSVTVLVDNDIARQNLQKMAEGEGHGFSFENKPEGAILVTILATEGCKIGVDDAGGLVVAIGSGCMGSGSDELGATLMKSFIFSLTEQDGSPDQILFFNGGIHLTCEGSAALDDLAALAAKGVTINSCGACLNYYQKTDKLKIGNVTNMFMIVQTMAQAKRLITL